MVSNGSGLAWILMIWPLTILNVPGPVMAVAPLGSCAKPRADARIEIPTARMRTQCAGRRKTVFGVNIMRLPVAGFTVLRWFRGITHADGQLAFRVQLEHSQQTHGFLLRQNPRVAVLGLGFPLAWFWFFAVFAFLAVIFVLIISAVAFELVLHSL